MTIVRLTPSTNTLVNQWNKPLKTNPLKLATLALLPAVLLTFTSCSTTGGDEEVVALETADGAAIVDTFLATFREFPPSQKAGSFSLDQVMENLSKGAGGN